MQSSQGPAPPARHAVSVNAAAALYSPPASGPAHHSPPSKVTPTNSPYNEAARSAAARKSAASPPPRPADAPRSASYDGGASPQTLVDTPASAASDGRGEASMAKSIIMSEQLEALTTRVPIAGQTVSAIIRLMDLCVAAKPVAQNARELARLCLDVVDLIEDLVDMDDVLNESLFKVLPRPPPTHTPLLAACGLAWSEQDQEANADASACSS